MNKIIPKIIILTIILLEALGISTFSEGSTIENELLFAINFQRGLYGSESLSLSDDLCDVAEIRAVEIACQWSHVRPDGTKFDALINDLEWEVAGENLAKCSDDTDCKSIVQAWMNSELHRINIVFPRFRQCGIGLYKQNNTMYIVLILTN